MKTLATLTFASTADLERHILHLRRFHETALVAANQSVAAAILTGLELLAIQENLKKCKSCTFEVWLSNHEGDIGFSRRTAFNYTRLAHGMRAKLADAHVDALLSLAPSDLSPEQQKRLLKVMHKAVDGQSLGELYLDYGIAKPPRKDPGSIVRDPANNGADHRSGPNTALIIQDELFGNLDKHGRMVEWWSKPVKIGNGRVPVWQTMTEEQKREMERRLELTIRQSTQMLDQLKEARARK